MKKHRRELQTIGTGAMADIAFLLLIFFLISTTMDTDTGIIRRLPQYTNNPKDGQLERRERNVLVILVNRENRLMVQGKEMKFADLKDRVKEFIENPKDNPKLPERTLTKVKDYGPVWITSKHVISLRSDRGTSYKTYITVQNELTRAYNELRNEAALKKWRTAYSDLDDDKKKVIEKIYHLSISEAEPNEISGH